MVVTDEHFKVGIETMLKALELVDDALLSMSNTIDETREKLDEATDTLEDLAAKVQKER